MAGCSLEFDYKKSSSVFLLFLFVASASGTESFSVDTRSEWADGTFTDTAAGNGDLRTSDVWREIGPRPDLASKVDGYPDIKDMFQKSGGNWYVLVKHSSPTTAKVHVFDSDFNYLDTEYDLSSETTGMDAIYFDGSNWWAYGYDSGDKVYKYDSSFNYQNTKYSLDNCGLESDFTKASDGNWTFVMGTGSFEVCDVSSDFTSESNVVISSSMESTAAVYQKSNGKWYIGYDSNTGSSSSGATVGLVTEDYSSVETTYSLPGDMGYPAEITKSNNGRLHVINPEWSSKAPRQFGDSDKTSGTYTSKIYQSSEKLIWDEIQLGGVSGNDIQVTVQTSDDDFSTVNESTTFSDSTIQSGTSTYQTNFDFATKYVRVNVSLTEGTSPTLGSFTVNSKIPNKAPKFNGQELLWDNIGGAESRTISYNISDPNGNDISSHSSPPSGTVSGFTNSTYNISNINTDFDHIPSITDFGGLSGANIQSNFTLSKTVYVENSTGTVNESWQTIRTNVTIQNQGDDINYTVSDSPPAVLRQTVVDGDTTFTDGLSGSVTIDWQYLVDRVTSTVFSAEKDTSKTSTVDEQHLIKRKQFGNNLSSEFTRLTVEAPSFTDATCTNCVLRTISCSGNSKCNETYNASGDFITEERNFSFIIVPSEIDLNSTYTGKRQFQMNETKGFVWNDVDITGNVTEPDTCSQTNNTQVDLPASAFQNYTVGFNCDPGDIGTPVFTLQDKGDFERAWMNTTLTINSNLTEDLKLQWPIKESNLDKYGQRDAGSLEAIVKGKRIGLSVQDVGDTIHVNIRDDFQTSSLHKGDVNASLTYTIGDDGGSSGGSGGGGSGGGGGGGDGDDSGGRTVIVSNDSGTVEPDVTFSNRRYFIPPDSNVTKSFVVVNTGGATRVSVDVPLADKQPECGLFQVQSDYPVEADRSLHFNHTGVYDLAAGSQGLSNKFVRTFQVKISVPEESKLEKLTTDGRITCKFQTDSTNSKAGSFKLTVVPQKNPVASLISTTFQQLKLFFTRILPI